MYGFTSSINYLPALHTYEKAQEFFNRTKPMRSGCMESHERPMHPRRGGIYKKFRVAKVEVDGHEAYDLIFYHTPVIRLFKPNPDGTRHVSIRYYNTISTREFMRRQGWWRAGLITTNGSMALIEYTHFFNSSPSVFFTLDAKGALIVERSWHAPLCKFISSAEDKQQRKDFKRILQTVFDMLHTQEFSIREEVMTSGGRMLSSRATHAYVDVKKYVSAVLDNPDTEQMLSVETITTMEEMVKNKFCIRMHSVAHEKLVEQRALKVDGAPRGYIWGYTDQMDFLDKVKKELAQTMDIKPSIIAVRDIFLKECGYMNKNKKVEVPTFSAEKPMGSIYRDKDGVYRNESELLRMAQL
jgi:hypothetical protein